MATTYSDFYNEDVTVEDGTAGASSIVLASTAAAQAVTTGHIGRAGLVGARVKAIIARAIGGTIGMASGDVLRMFTLPSSARIFRISFMAAGSSTTYAADLGLYLAGTAHDGAVQDADLFASALALASGATMTDCFVESTVLTDEDRGRPLWHLLGIGAGSDTSDPQTEYDICLTSTASGTGAIEEVVVICEYTSG